MSNQNVEKSINESRSRAVVVTGVSSGIGAAIARHLMDNGYLVFGSVRNRKDADDLVQSHKTLFHPLVFDVRHNADVKAAAKLTHEILSGQQLSALVNNAGLALFGPMEYLDDKKFEDTFAVNVFGTRNVSNAFIPLLRLTQLESASGSVQAHAGKIINISSLSGILNTPMNGAYCISKHAMESMGEIYRRELFPFGIDVCSIRSGPIQSEIWNKNIDSKVSYNNADYDLMAENAQSVMRKAAKTALPAAVVAKLVQDIIENRKRKIAYEIGAGSMTAKLLSSYLPTRIVDKLIDRALSRPMVDFK